VREKGRASSRENLEELNINLMAMNLAASDNYERKCLARWGGKLSSRWIEKRLDYSESDAHQTDTSHVPEFKADEYFERQTSIDGVQSYEDERPNHQHSLFPKTVQEYLREVG
jgi:hypothetical protein